MGIFLKLVGIVSAAQKTRKAADCQNELLLAISDKLSR